MPDPLFADLYRHTEQLTWASAEQVYQRARQRTRRTRIAAALASVVAVTVVATGAAALANRPDGHAPVQVGTAPPTPSHTPSSTPSPPQSPSPTISETPASHSPRTSSRPSSATVDPAIPAAATLQLADLPKGFRFTGGNLDGDWTLESVTIYCQGSSPSITPREVARRGAVFDSPTDRIIQRVTRHAAGNAATAMDRVRQLVADCVPYRQGDSLSILAEGLGGEESLLVGSVIEGIQSRWLFVRQGDLVSQVRLDSQTTPAEAQRYARPAADRLCAGTDAC